MCLLHLHHLHMCCRACVHLINAHIEDLRPCDKRPSMNPLLLAWSQCGSRNKSHRKPESKFKIGWERSWSPLVHLFLLLFSWGLRRGADMKTSPTAQSRVNRQMRDLIAGMAPYKLPHACYTVIGRSPYILGPRSICFRFVICFQWLRPQQRTGSSWGSTWYEDCWPFAIIRCKELIIVMAFFPHTIEISSNKTSFSPSFNFLHIISCDFAPKPPHDTQQKAPVATGLGHVAQQLSLAVNQPIWNICNCQNGWKSSPKWLGVNIPKNIRSFTHHPPSIFESIYLKITIILGVLPQMIILSSQFQVMWSRVPRMATWTVRLLKLCSLM